MKKNNTLQNNTLQRNNTLQNNSFPNNQLLQHDNQLVRVLDSTTDKVFIVSRKLCQSGQMQNH